MVPSLHLLLHALLPPVPDRLIAPPSEAGLVRSQVGHPSKTDLTADGRQNSSFCQLWSNRSAPGLKAWLSRRPELS